MNFVIPVALQIHLFSKNKKVAGYMQESNRTLLKTTDKMLVIIHYFFMDIENIYGFLHFCCSLIN